MISCIHFILALFFVTMGIMADEATLAPYREMITRSGFAENDEVRRFFVNVIQSPTFPKREPLLQEYKQRSNGRRIRFELKKDISTWYIIFRNQRGEFPRETYPIWGRGNWVIKKDSTTGKFLQAKIFLLDGDSTFARIFPKEDNRTKLDVYLFNKQLGNTIILPVSFEDLLVSPFARIVSMSEHAIDWRFLFPNPEHHQYANVAYFTKVLQQYNEHITELEDAAIDRGGRNVFIETKKVIPPNTLPTGQTGFNCAGYVKWIGDGLYSAWKEVPGNLYLDIDNLRQPTSRNNRNSWSWSRTAINSTKREALGELLRDPYFGLDWNRNLAYQIESARLGRNLLDEEKKQMEVGDLPGLIFREDMGYPLEDLNSALYRLAILYPGSIYLVAINSRFVSEDKDPDTPALPLHQYWHVAILAPWFGNGSKNEEKGRFHVMVLDTGDVDETLLEKPEEKLTPKFMASIMRRALIYAKLGLDDDGNPLKPEVTAHLIRLEIPPNFQPMPLPQSITGREEIIDE